MAVTAVCWRRVWAVYLHRRCVCSVGRCNVHECMVTVSIHADSLRARTDARTPKLSQHTRTATHDLKKTRQRVSSNLRYGAHRPAHAPRPGRARPPHIAKKTTSHPWRLDAQPHRAVEAPAGLKACFEPLFSTSSPALSRGHYDSLSTPRLDKFCEPMGWPPAQPSFSGAPSPTVRRDRESTKSPLLLAAARAMQFRSPRACCRRGAKVSCSAGGCLSHGVMMQRVCC